MSTPLSEFEELMRRVRAGCPKAAQEVFDLYSEPIRLVVRRRLHFRLRQQYDSIDFLQAAWASFFQADPEQFAFRTPDDLIGFLSRIAYQKVTDVFRQRMQSDRYNLNREEPLAANAELPVRQPSPSQLAIAEEQWERLLRGQPPLRRRVLELLRMGYGKQEVADQTGIHPKVIQRFLQKLLQRLDNP